MIKRALISVSDKTGIEKFAEGLHKQNIEIISTGGTAKVLMEAKIPVTPIEDITKFPECFSGRVKTMHPLIMGGVLFRRGDKEHEAQAKELGIEPIDLVVVNLYPFEERRRGGEEREEEMIELIDIGGPTLLRSAAKNHDAVTVVCDPEDYDRVLKQIESDGDTSESLRKELAEKVFMRTALYDSSITEWMSDGANVGIMLTNGQKLRYGENPHQHGAYFDRYGEKCLWQVLQEEKPMSYLNILDADATWRAVCDFQEPTAVFVKHANPSGVASNASIEEAFQSAYDADRLSAFGVVIAINRLCTPEIVQKIIDQKMFVEVMIALEYDKEALALFTKKPKIRVLRSTPFPVGDPDTSDDALPFHSPQYRSAFGGMILQNDDRKVLTEKDLTVVTSAKPSADQIRDLLFAWKVVKHAKSNAIVFAKDQCTVGIGCGQTSRVDSAIIAARKASAYAKASADKGERSKGAVMASDAFFPFPDSVEEAAKNGIAAIIQPGGSIRDDEVFKKAEELGVAMVTTGVRAFRH